MDNYRESIWGIRPRDRKWFQLFTMIGGIAGSVILAVLEIKTGFPSVSPSETARNLVLGIGASFVASGFVIWGALQARELMSAVADWIREATQRRRERWRQEAYLQGYTDAQQGKPPRPPRASDNGKGRASGTDDSSQQDDQ